MRKWLLLRVKDGQAGSRLDKPFHVGDDHSCSVIRNCLSVRLMAVTGEVFTMIHVYNHKKGMEMWLLVLLLLAAVLLLVLLVWYGVLSEGLDNLFEKVGDFFQ